MKARRRRTSSTSKPQGIDLNTALKEGKQAPLSREEIEALSNAKDCGEVNKVFLSRTQTLPMETRVSMTELGVIQLTVTSGREVYPYQGGSLEIGPMQVVLPAEPGKPLDEVYTQARQLLEELTEAEFALKRHNFDSRMRELNVKSTKG